MSQDELARLLGSSRQTINKTLQIMVERGYVEVQYAKIYFRDIEAMRRDYAYIMGPEQVTLNP
jgi:biotin operon repressor